MDHYILPCSITSCNLHVIDDVIDVITCITWWWFPLQSHYIQHVRHVITSITCCSVPLHAQLHNHYMLHLHAPLHAITFSTIPLHVPLHDNHMLNYMLHYMLNYIQLYALHGIEFSKPLITCFLRSVPHPRSPPP